jgi:hypothetical protein
LTFPIFYLILWVNWWLHILSFNASLWYDNCWIHLVYHLPLRSLLTSSPSFTLFTLPMTLLTFQKLVIFDHYNGLIFTDIMCYDAYYVKSHPLDDFQVHIFPFDWFWELWLFNYPLTFTLYFPIINLMNWNWTKEVLSFDVSRTYVSNFSSIWFGNPKLLASYVGYRIWALMVVRENVLELIIMLKILFSSDSWVILHLDTCILLEY